MSIHIAVYTHCQMNKNPCSNRETHVLFEHGSEIENTYNEPCIICMTLYTESVEDQIDHFAHVFVSENVAYGYDVVMITRITITHVCFFALTLAGSLRRCLNTRPISPVFKQHPGLANVNACKNMCDPYIIIRVAVAFKWFTVCQMIDFDLCQPLDRSAWALKVWLLCI